MSTQITAPADQPSGAPATAKKSGGVGRFFRRQLDNPNKLLLLVAVLLLMFMPLLVGDDIALLNVLTLALTWVMFAASWDILSGYTGQVNFGHAAFIGTGAFTVGLLSRFQPGVSAELALITGAVLAALIGLVIGLPCLRLSGPYLALATLTAASALFQLAFVFKEQTGGEEGISGIKSPFDTAILGGIGKGMSTVLLGPIYGDARRFEKIAYVEYYVTFVIMVVMVGGLIALGYGKRGLVLRSIQQQESAAEAAGVPVTRYKLGAFVLSAFCAGLAGGLLGLNRGSVSVVDLLVTLSLTVILVSAVGGVGSIVGPAVGALVVVLLQNHYLDKIPGGTLRDHPELKVGAFALFLIILLMVQPRGLIPPLLQRLRDRSNRKLLEGSGA